MRDGHRSTCKVCERKRTVQNYDYAERYTRNNRERGHRPLEVWNELRKRNKIPQSVRVAKRRAMKKKADVSWADKQYMRDLYANAKEATEIFQSVGLTFRFEVDHIVPLVHKKVCGLHTEDNLQILSCTENRKKSNKFMVA